MISKSEEFEMYRQLGIKESPTADYKFETTAGYHVPNSIGSQCPSCGYCPHCGRMNPTRPAYPSYTMPMFVDKTDNYDMRVDPNKVYC